MAAKRGMATSDAAEYISAPPAEWRNWQTRGTQNPVLARVCRFEPDLGYRITARRVLSAAGGSEVAAEGAEQDVRGGVARGEDDLAGEALGRGARGGAAPGLDADR